MRGDEIETTVDPGYTLALTGDLIHSRRLAPTLAGDPAFAAVVERLRAADATFGNLEIAFAERDDPQAWVWWAPEDWSIGAEPSVIDELRALGVDPGGGGGGAGGRWGGRAGVRISRGPGRRGSSRRPAGGPGWSALRPARCPRTS